MKQHVVSSKSCSSPDKRYDLGEVGRYKINRKLGLDIKLEKKVLTKEDIITIIKYLVRLTNGKAEIDDIDHLSNRRVRTVGRAALRASSA
jgi:DNA-directed RNA polymerase subunit beta